MSPVKSVVLVAMLAGAAGSALASPQRITDTQFIEANRCVGLMGAKDLATDDLPALKAFVDQQSSARPAMAWDMADQARMEALHQAARASSETRARLIAERDGTCKAFIAPASMAGGGKGAAEHGAQTPR
jgi:hypothetical protein